MTRRPGRPRRPRAAVEAWPARAAAAAELGVILNQPTLTTKTMEGWLGDPSCPLPRGRGPIPKVALLVWLITSKRGPGRPADSSSNAIKSAQASIMQAKADAIAGKMVRVEDVHNAVDAAVDDLKRDFVEEIPAAVGAMAGKTGEEMTEETRALNVAALNRFSARDRAVKA